MNHKIDIKDKGVNKLSMITELLLPLRSNMDWLRRENSRINALGKRCEIGCQRGYLFLYYTEGYYKDGEWHADNKNSVVDGVGCLN